MQHLSEFDKEWVFMNRTLAKRAAGLMQTVMKVPAMEKD